MSLQIKYTFVLVSALTTFPLATLSGCAGEDPAPVGNGGAPSAGGAPSSGGAIGSGGATTSGGAIGSGGATASGGATSAGDPVKGQATYTSSGCVTCHGATASGAVGPNISGSKVAGIGNWTEAEFFRALRESIGRNNVKFCEVMAPYPVTILSDADVKDIFAFLRSTSSDMLNQGFSCP